ncbi:MAG: type II toxin-antitoxin system prevent-host-death family antitoxin [Dehalococcoidia bacterium]|nr:type II toxin-antitoxin system prevent-host-death family antitoxin [Dehalococcoidia bacterium]
MDISITATQFSRSLSDILNRVRYRGERFVIVRNGEPVATLAPPGASPRVTVAVVIAAIGHLKMPGEGFADDLEQAQRSQPKAELAVWPS